MTDTPPKVGLFVTCLVDLFRPVVGFAAIKLLENAGCTVSVPSRQTCCGQPAFNSGDTANAKGIAQQVIETFAAFDYVVVPSGSCAGTIKVHYPEMFAADPGMETSVRSLAQKTFELTSFLHDVRHVGPIAGHYPGTATYHDSCSGLRELGIKAQPRRLLSGVEGLAVREMKSADTCCGFGGLFCVKYPEISQKIVDGKVEDIVSTDADTLLGGDMGCLLNMAGRLQRRSMRVKVRHVAEVLAGMTEESPPIGEPAGRR